MCRSRSSLIGGAKKSHGKISRPNPIGKHIQVLQHNLGQSSRAFREMARRKLTRSNRLLPDFGATQHVLDAAARGVSRGPMLMAGAVLAKNRTKLRARLRRTATELYCCDGAARGYSLNASITRAE